MSPSAAVWPQFLVESFKLFSGHFGNRERYSLGYY